MGSWSDKSIVLTFLVVVGGQSGGAMLFQAFRGNLQWPLDGLGMAAFQSGMFFSVCLLAGMLALGRLVRHFQNASNQTEEAS
jgi:hypothetical protein